MIFIKNFFSVFLFLLLSFVSFASYASAESNLLTNPGAEEGDLTGWNVIANAGDGWSVDFDNVTRSGDYAFMPSYGVSRLSQTVTLSSFGYTAHHLDVEKPTITATVYTKTRGDQAGRYYVTYKLLAGDGTTVVSSSGDTFGNSEALIDLDSGDPWTARTYTFSNYPSGVRYAYIEFGGSDQSTWAGHYGTHFDDASITLPSPSTLGSPAVVILPIIPLNVDGEVDFDINGGANTTSSRDVNLNFKVDSTKVLRYAVSLDPNFSDTGQINLTSNASFVLPETPGNHTIYVKFFSPTGHSVTLSKSIEYKPNGINRPQVLGMTTSTKQLFTRNLRQKSVGEDVKALQVFLNQNGYMVATSGNGAPGQETTFFGGATAKALAKFQEANSEKILAPYGLTKGTGILGQSTRDFINSK